LNRTNKGKNAFKSKNAKRSQQGEISMKDWLFISDFDGTLTHKDFYKIVIEKFQPQLGRELERQWRSGEITVYEFLQRVFASLDRSEQEIFEAILMIPIDRDAKEFIQRVKTAGGDFLILSAGTAYYIERLLKHLGIEGVTVIANPGVYRDRGIQMQAEQTSPYYSEVYGIDKGRVVSAYKACYRRVYFAGDSEPDTQAAMNADVVFAKPGLARILQEKGRAHTPFTEFNQVLAHLVEQGVIAP
jgi:2-hydroxy-3-keto-5-methylthiopentenyl-1-phosphate phosphatase